MLAALFVVFALYIGARFRYAGKAPVKLPAQNCDSTLWNHINQKERLQLIDECTAVEGRVVSLHRNSDGDIHIGLDPDQKTVLNLVNLIHAHGDLVVEIICEHTPNDADNKSACGDFHSQVTIPNVGDRVRVTGSYITDRDNSWNEVHPVTRIEILH
jgi:hypothetical protein